MFDSIVHEEGFGGSDSKLTSTRWWDEKNPANVAYHTFRRIESADAGRLADYREFYRLYANRDVADFHSSGRRSRGRVTLNLVRSVVDTAVARIAQQKPKARFQTHAGNFSLRRRARLLERAVDTIRYVAKTDICAVDSFRDSCLFGTGAFQIIRNGETIRAERVFPGDVFVDQVESRAGKPRNLYRRRWIDRQVLKHRYAKNKPKISAAIDSISTNKYDFSDSWGYDSTGDQIEVLEAWHLSPGNGVSGRHIIAIQNRTDDNADNGITLWDKPYDGEEFDILFIRWQTDPDSFWGLGLVDELLPLQVEINVSMARLQAIVKLIAPQLWQEITSRVRGSSITNKIGAINLYQGKPPEWGEGARFPVGLVQYIENLWNKGFIQSGMNLMFAGDRPPPGVDSSLAIQELADQGSSRFSQVTARWEQMFLDMTECIVVKLKSISKDNPKFSLVAAKDRHTIDEVQYSEVDMDRDSYILRMYPASSLPLSPGHKLQKISEMINIGMLSPTEAKGLLDWPDLDEFMALDRASSEALDYIIEEILDEGRFHTPEPFLDFQLGLKKAQAAYNRSIPMKDVPEAHRKALRNWMLALQQQISKAQEAQALQQAGLQAAPDAPLPPGPTGVAPQAVRAEDAAATV